MTKPISNKFIFKGYDRQTAKAVRYKRFKPQFTFNLPSNEIYLNELQRYRAEFNTPQRFWFKLRDIGDQQVKQN
jgi:hypothetical protein